MIRVVLNLNDTPIGRKEFEAGQSPVIVGRQPGCALHINDLGVSREHCRLSHQAGRGWVVEDLGSSNGTHLNRRRLVSPQVLHDDDVIQVGQFVLIVTTGSARGKESQSIGWQVAPESMERSAARKAHLAPTQEADSPVLIQQDAMKLGSAQRCEVRLRSGPPLVALLVRGYGGFQLINVSEDPSAVRVKGEPLADRQWLRDEDRLEFGEVSYVFHAGLPMDSFGTVQMNAADLDLESIKRRYGED